MIIILQNFNNKMTLRYCVYIFIIFIFILFVSGIGAEASSIYYVDSANGNDLNTGRSEVTAWRTIHKVNIMSFSPGDEILFKRGGIWREQLIPHSGDDTGYIKYGTFGTGNKPLLLGSLTKNDINDWNNEGGNVWSTSGLSTDIGNLIFNDEALVGVKVRNEAELDTQGEFWYDVNKLVLKVYSLANPAMYYSNIECALNRHIIKEDGKSYINYDNLDIRYGGAHGIGGGNVHHIVVRDCDLSYIGGGRFSEKVRYGNGIEFWNSSHDTIVEGCTLREIYDAALTTQGNGDLNVKYNQSFRNNIIWNSEYCFEYWNQPSSSTTDNIYFEYNTCVNAGYGWGHSQRWIETDAGWHNGRHLAFYKNTASTTNFYVLNNIFYEAKNVDMYIDYPWDGIENIYLDHNIWYQISGHVGHMIYYLCTWSECAGEYTMDEFSQYQTDTGKDTHSLATAPLFIDPENNDFHPAIGSPVCTLSAEGSFIGALPCIEKNTINTFLLLFPFNNIKDLGTTIEFKWERVKYSQGIDIDYILSICEDENFTKDCVVNKAIASNVLKGNYYASFIAGLLFLGLIFPESAKGNRIVLLIVTSTIVITLLISCGSSDSNGTGDHYSVNEVTQTISGLKSSTTYFWKVFANNSNGSKSESAVWSFTTR